MATLGLVLLLATLPILFFLTSKVKAGKVAPLRPLKGLQKLPGTVDRSAETGLPLHVSVGVAGVGGAATAETWAGLTLLAELADRAASCSVPLVVTVADPTVLPLAQNVVRRAYARNGAPEGYDASSIRFVAPTPLAYAAGVMGILERERLAGNVMVGTFGDEVLFMGEAGARLGMYQLAGASDPATLPLIQASADDTLLGEEIFAGGAYTRRLPIQIGSLMTADWLRWAVIIAMILLAAAKLVA